MGTRRDHPEVGMEPSRTTSNLGVAAVVCLIAAFALSALGMLIAPAFAEGDLAAVRDDDAQELAVVEQDPDDDDDDDGDDDDDDDDATKDTRSGSRSIGSHSRDTRTGTTNGTGISRTVSNSSSRSRDTKTGTTRGTGPSRSVSNSS
jgi:hypothetical protein